MKKILINAIFIFIISSISHFIYRLFPNNVISIFFPINESIWEHLKLLFTSSLIFSIFNLIIRKDKNNFFSITFIRSIILITILLVLFLPIYYIFGANIILTLILLFISIIITEIIMSKISNKKLIKYLNFISVFLIIISYFIFGYLTYNPPKFDLFRDPTNNSYGLFS